MATDSLNPVLLQSYFDAEVVRFAEELLTPSPDRSSRLGVEPVPRRFHGKSYSELFTAMIGLYGVVVMGLYRAVSGGGPGLLLAARACSTLPPAPPLLQRRALGAPLSYVYTTPDPATVLYSTEEDEDLMYVLTSRPLFTGPEALAPHEVSVASQPAFAPTTTTTTTTMALRR